MGDRHHALHTRRGLGLSTPSGEQFRVETAWFWAGPPATMRVQVDWQQWDRAVDESLFGLDDETVPEKLIPDSDVVVEARLDPGLETTVPDDEASLRARLADPDDPLARTESWRATEVRQQGRLPDATDLTEAVFDDDPDRRADSREFRLRQVRPEVRVVEREVDDARRTAEDEDDQRSAVDFSGLVTDAVGASDSDVSTALRPVVDALAEESWPYEVAADGSRVSLEPELDGRRWGLSLEPAESGERCTATSVHPDRLSDEQRDELAADLLVYNASVTDGGFEFGESGETRFRTSFVPGTDPLRDVLGAHATAMAEWYDRLAG
jgi:hypothetical protein